MVSEEPVAGDVGSARADDAPAALELDKCHRVGVVHTDAEDVFVLLAEEALRVDAVQVVEVPDAHIAHARGEVGEHGRRPAQGMDLHS